MALIPLDLKRAFPPEVRELIFEHALFVPNLLEAWEEYQTQTHSILSKFRPGCPTEGYSEEYKAAMKERDKGYANIFHAKRKTPALLIALRCDPNLYSQALKVYYTINTFILNPQYESHLSENLALVSVNQDLSSTTLLTMKKLTIMIDLFHYSGDLGGPDKHWEKEYLNDFNLFSVVPRMANLQVLRFKTGSTVDESHCRKILQIVQKMENLTRVELETYSRCSGPDKDHGACEDAFIEGMNDVWGVQAKLMQVYETGGMYFWQSPKGSSLKWSDVQYSRYFNDTVPTTDQDFDRTELVSHKFSWDENGRKWEIRDGTEWFDFGRWFGWLHVKAA